MKCIVLAGGSGDRLWPLSRKNYPKQFINIKENRSMFQETIARNMPFCDEFYIITDERYRYIVEGQLQVFQGLKYQCFLEQVGKKTAPAVAIACLCSNQSETFLIVSTDHIIDGGDYKGSMLSAMGLMKQGFLVSIGVEVGSAHHNYGYFKQDNGRVLSFSENVSKEEAEFMKKDSAYLWDTGLLLVNAGDYLHELKVLNPDVYKTCYDCAKKLDLSGQYILISESFSRNIPSISIGKAVTEHSKMMRVVNGNFKWRRILDLEALDNYYGSKGLGDNIKENCKNVSILNYTDQKLVVANELEDIMIVNTSDATYVSKKGNTEQIKSIMKNHYKEQKKIFDESNIFYTSWGIKETLSTAPGYKVKKITIFPGKFLTKHIHKLRSEHWSIVSGTATITLNDYTKDYLKNESIFVPMGTPHQIVNKTAEDVVIVEVSIGKTEELIDNELISVSKEKTADLVCDNIIKLEPAFKDNLWGGTKLRDIYGKNCDYTVIAESWELSTHKAGQSIVSSGKHKGMMLGEYIRLMGRDILGWKCDPYDKFPLLIKFIDARENLSIQVHPDDDYALRVENEYGKNEMWYIVDCEPDSYLYCGFNKDVIKNEVMERTKNGTLTEVLNKLPVYKGQTIFVRAGTVHAIGKGILICEIQQSSNVTYRLYDYGRKDKYGELRELHIDKALDVINFSKMSDKVVTGLSYYETALTSRLENEEGCDIQLLGVCKYFSVMKYSVLHKAVLLADESSFLSIIIIEGEGSIRIGEDEFHFKATDSFFIPAKKMKIEVFSKCTFLKTQI
jgi:mannose-1-phosphate guanylyltransferase/mannose-6-phosphate isomerase